MIKSYIYPTYFCEIDQAILSQRSILGIMH